MSFESADIPSHPRGRGRGQGRGRSRGGLGKYLRARGRGRGGGRPAEFHKRLVLEDEEVIELDPESEEAKEMAKEMAKKYGKRHLTTNADRYIEPEPVLNSDGEEEKEPEVDLASFLARQRLDDSESPSKMDLLAKNAEDDSDVDESLLHLIPSSEPSKRHKGKIQSIEWNEELEEIRKEKEIADANRELKNRFKVNVEKQKTRQARNAQNSQTKDRKGKKEVVVEAPPLPTDEIGTGSEKEKMEDFLDDLLA